MNIAGIKRKRLMHVNRFMAQEERRQQWEANQAYKASEEYQLDCEFRQIMQEADCAQKLIEKRFNKSVSEMKYELFALVVAYLKIEYYQKCNNHAYYDDVAESEIDEVMLGCVNALKVLKSACDIKCVKELQNSPYTFYERLLNELIEVDPRFIKFASYNVVNKKGNEKLKSLPKEGKQKYVEYIESVLENPDKDYSTEEYRVPVNEESEIAEEIIEKIEKAKQEMGQQLHEVAKNMSASIYSFVINKAKFGRINHGDEVLSKLCNRLISTFSKLSNIEQRAVSMGISPAETELYKLFDELIELDVRFAAIAPKKNLEEWDLDLSNVSEYFQEKIYARYAKVGLSIHDVEKDVIL